MPRNSYALAEARNTADCYAADGLEAAATHPTTEMPLGHQPPQCTPNWPSHGHFNDTNIPQDHFVRRGELTFAGTHLLLDLWGAQRLDDLEWMESTLRSCIEAAGATLLHIHLHHFTPSGGISGVAVLAESHISVHTWPERDFAAFDVFMCGDAQPEMAIPVLKRSFLPKELKVTEQLRGLDQD